MLAASLLYGVFYGLFFPAVYLGFKAKLNNMVFAFWLASIWTSFEIILSDVFLPVPSIAIGYFIWPFSLAIQVADITGVFGVSFWLIMVNVSIYTLLRRDTKKNQQLLLTVGLITLSIFGYGLYTIQRNAGNTKQNFRITLVHTAIATKDKDKLKDTTFQVLIDETTKAAGSTASKINLVIWPETSIPVFLRSIDDRKYISDLVNFAKEHQIPILLGARSFSKSKNSKTKIFNSAFLVPTNSFINQEYRKNILTPFVESVPFSNNSTLVTQIFGPSKIDKGNTLGKFKIFSPKIQFGVVICYEIFFPNYVRLAADQNSGFLVNISNDEYSFANFKPAYKIPIPHLVYRAVENKKYVVRSANWGYSMFVSPLGQITEFSSIGSTGSITGTISPSYDQTFLSKNGYVLAKSLLMITFIWFLLLKRRAYNLQSQLPHKDVREIR